MTCDCGKCLECDARAYHAACELYERDIWDEPLIRKGSNRPAVVFALCCGFGAAVAFAALLLHLIGGR